MAGVFVNDTITLGSILIGILVALPALFVLFKGAKWKGLAEAAEETAKVYAEGREAYRLKSDRLEGELKEALVLIGQQKEIIAKLEALPNLTVLQKQMGILAEQATKSILEALEHHEERAETRHEALVAEQARSSARAQDRHEKILQLFDTVGHVLGEITNGKEER